ncbi:MAG TPA: helix-turn-helix domain-containing protein [Ktedonobacteraceae bacterium]|nr:helix-turn-helix domain-containing protein [Ktedonobacteraceae bacterium]
MAKSRSIPTALLSDPDYMELTSDAQVILIMLILTADDEGRGQAHTGMLSRHFNKSAEQIEHALATLASLDLITCYTVGRHRYYQLLRWWEWQTLSKPTPSRFPMPPTEATPEALCGTAPRETQEIPGESAPEGERERKRREKEPNPEEKQKEEEELPPGITRFPQLPPPAAPSVPSDRFSPMVPDASEAGRSAPSPSLPSSDVPVHQVAEILRLPVSGALTRLVTEYTTFGSLALLGEADAAREWIDDTARNRSKKRMTVAFFRRWLKREQEGIEQRQMRRAHPALQEPPSSAVQSWTTPPVGSVRGGSAGMGGGPRLPSLMHLAEADQQARGGRY